MDNIKYEMKSSDKNLNIHGSPQKSTYRDPVCSMTTDTPESWTKYEHKGQAYYFCSEHCLHKFKEDPEQYIAGEQEKHGGEAHEVKDPVCGMTTDDPESWTKYEHEGKAYYFCSEHCLHKFKEDPDGYLSGKPEQAATEYKPGLQYTCPMDPEIVQDHPGSCPKCGMALEPMTPAIPATRTEYTCPMHPEIVRDQPGSCPKCGMALEPRTVEVEESNPEYEDMKRRFILGAILSVPLVLIAMRHMIPGLGIIESWASAKTLEWTELILATPVVLWAGWPGPAGLFMKEVCSRLSTEV